MFRKKTKYVNGMNEKTFNLFFDNELNTPINPDEKNDLEKSIILDTIDFYTRYQEKVFFKNLIKKFYKLISIDFGKIVYDINTDSFAYIDRENNLYISFNALSSYVDDDEYKELTSIKRYHKCHRRSIWYSQYVESSKVLTGYVYTDTFKYLHSVIEYELNGNSFIIDWTKGVEMSKDDYFALTKYKVLSVLDSKDIRRDINRFKKVFCDNNKGLNYKIYTVFGNEILSELDKKEEEFNKLK